MLEIHNRVKYPKLGNPLLIWTWQLLEAMETHDIHVILYIIKFM
jgi:hypothetical protein